MNHRACRYLGGGVKCDYDGHEKRFYNNVMLGTTAGCWHTCAYKVAGGCTCGILFPRVLLHLVGLGRKP